MTLALHKSDRPPAAIAMLPEGSYRPEHMRIPCAGKGESLMSFKNIGRAAACLVFAVAPGLVLANDVTTCADGPVQFEGRHYEVVGHNGVSWVNADIAARAKRYQETEVFGHLATITSEAEDSFLESLRKCARNTNKPGTTTKLLGRDAVWVGGFQEDCTPQPGCGWKWVKDEGAISTPQFPLDSYSNWLKDGGGTPAQEPNNTGGNERHITIGHTGKFGWNDEGFLGNIGGYIVEYDTSSNISAIDCVASDEGGGCQTTAGQTLVLPPGVDPDGSIGVRTFEFTDPRIASGKCGIDTLTLFGGADPRTELSIPAYLCGSPKFLVVEVKTDFDIKQGTVIVENNPLADLPSNFYDCYGPKLGLPASQDPQQRDVVAWQSTRSRMLESDVGEGTDFPGALGEFTFECGSSRGSTKFASYFVIGMHINFGPGYDFTDNPDGVNERFVALTGYKLELLRVSVEQSKRALKNGDYTRLRSHITNAIKFHNGGQFDSALTSIEEFLAKVADSVYDDRDGKNHNGEHLMRANNIRFTYMEKVIPFAQ